MSNPNIQSHGNGINGRVDGVGFDARHILAPGFMALHIGEVLQEERADAIAGGLEPTELTGFPGVLFETMSTMPLDAKAAGLACAVAGAGLVVETARNMREIAFENVAIASGVNPENVVPPISQRTIKKAKAYGVAGVSAVAAYKLGEQLPLEGTISLGMTALGASVIHMARVKKRVTGRY